MLTVTDTLYILFPVNVGHVDETFADNAYYLNRIQEWVKVYNESDWNLEEVLVVGSCSPDGNVEINERVSEERVQTMLDYCYENIPDFKKVFVRSKNLGRNWKGLLELEKGDTGVPFRREVIAIIEEAVNFRADYETALKSLKSLQYGIPYEYIETVLFNRLRAGYIYVTVTIPTSTINMNMTEEMHDLLGDEIIREYRQEIPEPKPEQKTVTEYVAASKGKSASSRKPFCMNFQTNLLYDAVLQPNVGIEFHLGRGWSIGVEWKYAWWDDKSDDWFWRTYGGDLFLRKWLGKQAKEKPLTGHHLGIIGQGLTYQYQVGKGGVMADEDHWNWGASLEYGYSLPVARRVNIDFDLGVGYMWGEYYDFKKVNGENVWVDSKSRHYIGPTKLAISLIWQIGCGNVNDGKSRSKKKGGK